MNNQYRVEEVPLGVVVFGGTILRGEVTGHTHKLLNGTVITTPTGGLYLETREGAKIVHEEHEDILLPPGKWAVIRQREYSSKDAVRLVTD